MTLELAGRERVAEDEQVSHPGRRAPRRHAMAVSDPLHRIDRRCRVGRRELARDAQRVVLFGRCRTRPGRRAEALPRAGRRERTDTLRGKGLKSLQELPDRVRGRPIARLPDSRLPATGQSLASARSGRIAQQRLEDVAEDDVRKLTYDGVAGREVASRCRRQVGDGRALGPLDHLVQLRWHEAPERGEERDRGGLRERQAIEFVAREPAHTLDDRGHPLGCGRRPADRTPGRGRPVRPTGRAWRSTGADPVGALAVVATTQLRVAQPVVGDVDPLRELEGFRPGDIRVVLAQEATPGQVDRLRAGVAGHPKPGIQIVAGEGLAWRHDVDIVVVRPGASRYAQAMRPMAGGESKGIAVSFIKRAQEAAAQAAEAARVKAQEASGQMSGTAGAGGTGGAAGTGGTPGPDGSVSEALTQDMLVKRLSSTGASAREALGVAKRGMSTVIEKIDPGTLAELVIKATALQEMTNRSLRLKGSPYRIAEISISASIPPAVSFAIQRLEDEPEELGADVVPSSELVEQIVESGDLVLALDGTTVDPSGVVDPLEVDGTRGAMPPSGISSDGS